MDFDRTFVTTRFASLELLVAAVLTASSETILKPSMVVSGSAIDHDLGSKRRLIRQEI